MGYLVETAGRVLLPAATEEQVLTVLEVRMSAEDGWFHADDPADTLDDLATYVGASLQRAGDWVDVVTDADGDPKWSAQATAFYRGLAGWVQEGEVRIKGEDGTAWSYVYSPTGVRQIGVNGWDGSPGDPAPSVARARSAPTSDLRQPLVPGSPEARAAAFAEPPPASTARKIAMAAALVGGVLLIIFIAVLVSGTV